MTDRESLIKVLGEALEAAKEPIAAGRVARATYYQDTRNPWDRIAAAVIAHHEESQWQPMKDAPKDRQIFAGTYGYSDAYIVQWHDGTRNYRKLAGWYAADEPLLTARPIVGLECFRLLPVPPKARPE